MEQHKRVPPKPTKYISEQQKPKPNKPEPQKLEPQRLEQHRTDSIPKTTKDSIALPLLHQFAPIQPLLDKSAPIHGSEMSALARVAQATTPDNFQSFGEHLAKSSTPTIIFKSASQVRFQAISYVSSVFYLWVAAFNVQTYLAVDSTSPVFPVAGMFLGAGWIGFACYCWLAPSKLVQSITALPAVAPQVAGRTSLRPTLSIQPLQQVPFWKVKPFEVSLSEVMSDRSMVMELEELRERKAQVVPRTAAAPKFFAAVAGTFADVKKMFNRNSNFTRIRVRNAGNWKLDMNNCEALDHGKALDYLIKVDVQPLSISKRLFR